MISANNQGISINVGGTSVYGNFIGTSANGTGDLGNLHGVLTQVGTVPDTAAEPVGTYTGEIHFDD